MGRMVLTLSCRDRPGVVSVVTQRLFGEEVVEAFPPGSRVIVGHDKGVATLIRLTHQE